MAIQKKPVGRGRPRKTADDKNVEKKTSAKSIEKPTRLSPSQLREIAGRLTDREVFCLTAYLLNGDRERAYKYSRREESVATGASLTTLSYKWFATDPVKAFLELNANTYRSRVESLVGDSKSIRDIKYDEYIEELEDIVQRAEKDTDKISALKQLAELRQLKKGAITEDDKKRIYLPQRCSMCKLYVNEKNKLTRDGKI